MPTCFIDTETRSRTPIQSGTDCYTADAECLLVTWAIEDAPVRYWECLRKDFDIPLDLYAAYGDPDVIFVAHNAAFDWAILDRSLGLKIPIERWRCTRAQAYSHGLPGSLELLGTVLGLPPEQQKRAHEGKELIQMFCVPQKDGTFIQPHERPQDWQRFIEYGVQDTATLREIYRRLPKVNYSGDNLRLWHLDQHINLRGFGFDQALATSAVTFLKTAKDKMDGQIVEATAGEVETATQRAKLLNYLQQKLGIDIPNMRAAEIREWLEHDDLEPAARFLLEMRLEGSKSSGAKYSRGLRMLGATGRMRHTMQFNGAGRTGRTSGKGFQPHNMARPVLTVRRPDGRMELTPVKAKYIDDVILPGIHDGRALDNRDVFGGPNEAAALALRHVIKAAPGNELVVADWSNIESRILAWVADEIWKLEAYRALDRGEGVDLYKLLFSQFFGTKIEDVNDTERQSGKVSELAFGYGGGVGAMVTMAAGYQMDLTPLAALVLPRATTEQLRKAHRAWRRAMLTNEDYELEPAVYKACDVLKQTYREANSGIDQFRHNLDVAVKGAVKVPGNSATVGRCRIWSTGTWLCIELPSKRRLLYANPRIQIEVQQDVENGREIRYEYVSYATARGKTWRREKAWSGLFVENIIQAIANDILRAALLRIDADTKTVLAVVPYLKTLPVEEQTAISLHVHDEVVLDLPIGSYPLERLLTEMTKPCSWSDGLPLAAAGWVNERYGKR